MFVRLAIPVLRDMVYSSAASVALARTDIFTQLLYRAVNISAEVYEDIGSILIFLAQSMSCRGQQEPLKLIHKFIRDKVHFALNHSFSLDVSLVVSHEIRLLSQIAMCDSPLPHTSSIALGTSTSTFALHFHFLLFFDSLLFFSNFFVLQSRLYDSFSSHGIPSSNNTLLTNYQSFNYFWISNKCE
jgi:hypothetical protein